MDAGNEACYVATLIPAQRKVPPLRERAADVTQSSAGPAARLECGLGPHVPSVPRRPRSPASAASRAPQRQRRACALSGVMSGNGTAAATAVSPEPATRTPLGFFGCNDWSRVAMLCRPLVRTASCHFPPPSRHFKGPVTRLPL